MPPLGARNCLYCMGVGYLAGRDPTRLVSN